MSNNTGHTGGFLGGFSGGFGYDIRAGRKFYNLDGIDDYIEVPTINLVIGDTFEVKVNGVERYTDYRALFNSASGEPNGIRSRLGNTEGGSLTLSLRECTLVIDGNPALNRVIPDDQLEHTLVFTATGNTSIRYIGSAAGGTSHRCNFMIYDFKVNDGSVYNYPINDGWASNPLIKNTADTSAPELWQGDNPVVVDNQGDQFSTIASSPHEVLEEGVPYYVSFHNQCNERVRLNLDNVNVIVQANTKASVFMEITDGSTSRFNFQSLELNTVGTITDITVKETTAGEAMNFHEERWGTL
jgi:hypothetical protein